MLVIILHEAARVMPTRHIVIVLFAACVYAAPLAADELRLKNGDRLTGEVTTLTDGRLKFSTAHGELDLPWEEVTGLTVADAIVTRTVDGTTTTIPGGDIDVATVVHLERPEPPLDWNGGANAGVISTDGNTEVTSLRFDGDLAAQTRRYRAAVNATVNRSEDSGSETARNWTISSAYDRFIRRRLYINSSAILTNDEFRDLDLRTALGLGLGYQLVDTSMVTVAVEGGGGWVNEAFETSPDDSYASVRESARADVFFGGERVVLFHRHDGHFGVTGNDNLFFKTQNGVRFGLIGGLVTTAQIDIDYDRSPAPGRVNTERNFGLTFGYRF
jgi:hypothetical protein